MLVPLAYLLTDPIAVPLGEGNRPLTATGEQNQDAENLLFLLAFAVVLPAALVLVPRIADRIAAGPNGPGLEALAPLL